MQTRRDAGKSAAALSLECLVASAALHSLRGVQTLLTTQWHSTPADLRETLVQFMRATSGSENRACLGAGAHLLRHSSPETAVMEDGDPKNQKSPQKDARPSDKTGRQPPVNQIYSEITELSPLATSACLRNNVVVFGLPHLIFL
eukprot:m.510981 g.510981  ORF g.510981 m.510981 type:complete len:145 (+) comp57424_c0_seq3:233-667(+)